MEMHRTRESDDVPANDRATADDSENSADFGVRAGGRTRAKTALISPEVGFDENGDAIFPGRRSRKKTAIIDLEVNFEEEEKAAVQDDLLWRKLMRWTKNTIFLLALLYGFICALSLLSDSFRVLLGRSASSLFSFASNPIAGLMVGLIVTVLFQSSSTSTSVVVSLVAAGALTVGNATPIIMGSNIGTSITNTIVAIGQVKSGPQFKRAFSGATIHDMFNILNVLVLLPIEWIVMAANDHCGFLCWFTGLLTKPMSSLKGGTFTSPLDYIVKPLLNLIVQVNKDAIQAHSYGCSATSIKCPSGDLSKWDYWCLNGKDKCIDPDSWHKKYDTVSYVKSSFMQTWGWSDVVIGIILLVLSLFILCLCLILMVKLLQAMILGSAEKYLRRALNMNGYLAIIVGALVTTAVQSSSVVTSTLTPLVGIGILSLEGMLPLTLGANIGTTTTSILASLTTGSMNSIQIALVHLFFNIFGIIIWYPVPFMRNVPLKLARKLGVTVQKYRWFGVVYMLLVFLLIPGYLLVASILIEGNTSMMWGGIGMVLATVALFVAFWVWYRFFNGKTLVLAWMEKTASLVEDDGADSTLAPVVAPQHHPVP